MHLRVGDITWEVFAYFDGRFFTPSVFCLFESEILIEEGSLHRTFLCALSD